MFGPQLSNSSVPARTRALPSRTAAVNDGPVLGPPGGIVLDGSEHDGRLARTRCKIRHGLPEMKLVHGHTPQADKQVDHANCAGGSTPDVSRAALSRLISAGVA